jgi:hypothetical protein
MKAMAPTRMSSLGTILEGERSYFLLPVAYRNDFGAIPPSGLGSLLPENSARWLAIAVGALVLYTVFGDTLKSRR